MENLNRIKNPRLHDRVVTAEEAAGWIQDGMTLGLSGFTRAGDVKAVPLALVDRAKAGEQFKVNVFTGASLGSDVDKMFAEVGIVNKRLPFQADPTMRKKINAGEHLFVDHHLSHVAELLRADVIETVDYAILEAISITEDGMIIPTTSTGNNLAFAENAKNIIVEINTAQPDLEGLHDLYSPGKQGERDPIPLTKARDRIGKIGIQVDPEKIVGIVFTNQQDSPSTIVPPDEETQIMANHLLDFLRNEIKEGRLTETLAPLQSGIGSVANAVLHGMVESEFENLEVYSEVLQDAVFDLIDAGKVDFASCCSITLSEEKMKQVFGNFEKYRDKLIMRPQEISNHPEIIRRLGLISINTALEFDIYGNVNSTHVSGTKMMNGIGGSGDFARNARLAIFVTKSVAKGGDISSIVPMVSHVDHTEHDVDVVVTEQGYADLRGLAPRERVPMIIENCAHPMYKKQLWDYYQEAVERGGQTPHVLEKALSWHTNFAENGTMKQTVEVK
ncbi:acetyl-CoA hydrolase/transferase family protein [Ornithinibacillus halophilus]|uniref:Succinyl-CoA:acetate CoA-transferase n=1 Tax=Ornithinibacillus halophilus TaxID=930117 RepID=A0A1M5GD22_9BACI|nr:acetyl-CoA hydrolase/transferase family protein [Ornithinibacillus halophilus]SHG01655.1 succinyl-CoA:acetate CoA-transferase [Ornithinibacillus halophilus]